MFDAVWPAGHLKQNHGMGSSLCFAAPSKEPQDYDSAVEKQNEILWTKLKLVNLEEDEIRELWTTLGWKNRAAAQEVCCVRYLNIRKYHHRSQNMCKAGLGTKQANIARRTPCISHRSQAAAAHPRYIDFPDQVDREEFASQIRNLKGRMTSNIQQHQHQAWHSHDFLTQLIPTDLGGQVNVRPSTAILWP